MTFHRIAESYISTDPNGVMILIRPEIPTIELDADRRNNLCGRYQGLGIETMHKLDSISFWQKLGYRVLNDDKMESPYAVLTHPQADTLTLFSPGLCPHYFKNPSLTYFNGKEGNFAVIDNLKAAGVDIVEEITVFNDDGLVDNFIIRDPGGLHSFIFNDG